MGKEVAVECMTCHRKKPLHKCIKLYRNNWECIECNNITNGKLKGHKANAYFKHAKGRNL